MKSVVLILVIVAGLLGAWLVGFSPTVQGENAVRIMPLGDSITQGSIKGLGYREPLWRKLRDHGCAVDFVGGQVWPRVADDVDPDHQGHRGWRADEIDRALDKWLEKWPPDVVLTHLGTNDVLHERETADIIASLDSIISKLRKSNSKVKILLAQVIPGWAPRAAATQRLNAAIATLAARQTSAQSQVVLVDHNSGYDAALNYDGLHPGPGGAETMADRWLKALLPILGDACQANQVPSGE